MKLSEKLLWDLPKELRDEYAKKLSRDPVRLLEEDETLFVKALNSLSWYELVELFGPEKLDSLLTDHAIEKLFPAKRREYYKNARRLLSKYSVSSAG